jgi:hypothetical protein
VWRGKFIAASPGFITTAFSGLGTTGVFAGQQGQIPIVLLFQSNPGVGGQVTIVPAPGAIAVLAPVGLIAARRRRTQRGEP